MNLFCSANLKHLFNINYIYLNAIKEQTVLEEHQIFKPYLHSHQHMSQAATEPSAWRPLADGCCSEAEGKCMLQEPENQSKQ